MPNGALSTKRIGQINQKLLLKRKLFNGLLSTIKHDSNKKLYHG